MWCASHRSAPRPPAQSAHKKSAPLRPLSRLHSVQTPVFEKPTVGEPHRYPKKKVAMLVAYIGTKFAGLQRNPGVHTVEDVLEAAIYQAGGILAANLGRLQNVGWRRSGRTDKGVHSVGNILVMKMQLKPKEALETMRQRINSFLPADVRSLSGHASGVKPYSSVRQTWNMMLPLFVAHYVLTPNRSEYHYLLPAEAFTYKTNLNEDKCAARMRELLALYKGTHNFHNYTNRRPPSDPACFRFMVSSTMDDPVSSFYRVRITGQSFMNHQIRKMIGTAVAAIRQDAPLSVIGASFDPVLQRLPTAPPGFLIKMRSDYSFYNKKWAGTHNGLYVRASLDFPQAVQESQKFADILLQHIHEVNEATHPFREWIDTDLADPIPFAQILERVPTRSLKDKTNEQEDNDADEDDERRHGGPANHDDDDDDDDEADKPEGKHAERKVKHCHITL